MHAAGNAFGKMLTFKHCSNSNSGSVGLKTFFWGAVGVMEDI